MFGIGVPELLIILVVALVIFGPGKLPEIGGALGKGIRDFKKSFEGAAEELKEVADKADSPDAAAHVKREAGSYAPRGKPRSRCAMMLRCTSEVPEAIVIARARSQAYCQ